jgi:hypothetical protein
MMKRLKCVVLVAASVLLLTACGSSENTSKRTTLLCKLDDVTKEISISDSPPNLIIYGKTIDSAIVDSGRIEWTESLGGQTLVHKIDRLSGKITVDSSLMGNLFKGSCVKKGDTGQQSSGSSSSSSPQVYIPHYNASDLAKLSKNEFDEIERRCIGANHPTCDAMKSDSFRRASDFARSTKSYE